jgi:hypothetical protein
MKDDDLPEFTEEMLAELKQKPVDLHLGAVVVRKSDADWYIKKYGPKPPGIGIKMLDVLIFLLFFITCDLIVLTWLHVFS